MLSRVAESIYWMSRYMERAEHVARFIDVNLNLSLDLPQGTPQQWLPLVVTSGDEGLFSARYSHPSREHVIQFLTFDLECPNSILTCLVRARENARAVRDTISAEMWEHINHYYLMVTEASNTGSALDRPHLFCEAVRKCGQHFLGVTDATMTHGEAWHFCQLGRMIERADKTSRMLDVKYFILLPSPGHVGTPFDDLQWSALLRSASGLEMYRQRHGKIEPRLVVDFLLLDTEFPRAVLHCLTRANQSLHQISGSAPGGFSNPPEQLLGQLQAVLAYSGADEIIRHGLHEFIDDLQAKLNQLGDAIHETYIAQPLLHAVPVLS